MKTNTLLNIIAGSALAVLASCSEDINPEAIGTSRASVAATDFVQSEGSDWGLSTRSSIQFSGAAIQFSWSQNDRLAIYADNGNGLTNFIISDIDEENPAHAQFKANGFNLRNGEKYHAFYPYDAKYTDKTSVGVNYEGMVQSANNNSDHLGAYDYQYASATAAGATEAANIQYTFSHASAICRFQITGLPSSVKFSSLSISANGIITKGNMDLTAETPAITEAAGNSSTQVIKLGTNGFSADNEGTLTVYATMAPVNLKGTGNVRLCLYSGDMILASFNVNGKNMVAGKAYAYSATYTAPSPAPSLPEGLEYVDLGLQLNGEPVLFANQNFSANEATTFPWTETDPVTAAWGLDWRTPTLAELELLFNKQADGYPLQWEAHVTGDNWDGVTVTNKIDPEKQIFLPAVYDSQFYVSRGYYWSSETNGSLAKYCDVVIDCNYGTIKTSQWQIGKSNTYMIRPVYVGNK